MIEVLLLVAKGQLKCEITKWHDNVMFEQTISISSYLEVALWNHQAKKKAKSRLNTWNKTEKVLWIYFLESYS